MIESIPPKTLSLITTDRCTASCKNCCFQCNPHQSRRLSLDVIRSIIDEVVTEFPMVTSCVFTGGECTTLGKDLPQAIEYAYSKKLICRIVTNGFWAKSEQCAMRFLNELTNKGLKEINLSTGDEHQKWIPYDKIVYACQAAVKLGLFVAVNIETTRNSKFSSKIMINDQRISKYIQSGKIIVKDSLWIEFDNTNDTNQIQNLNDGPCTNLFNTITVSSNRHLQACCGLTSKNNIYLDLGDLSEHSLKELYMEQFDDLVKLWLYTHGPKQINSFLCEKKGIPDDSYYYPHICSLCHHILENKQNINIIRTNIHSILPSVMLKYQFINKLITY